ncbi:MAG: serine/threonine protein kinase [Actinobacteria bacterium]|nr:MAG: serine/threonine protein kinase [Actinomycetota bacterium]
MGGLDAMASRTRIGTQVAGFRIESVLGRGGMSVVYVAEQVRLGRKVALKVLTTELAWDEQFRERFVRESQIAAAIDHPNIIPIYDAGEDDGLLYIAMRFVQGPDLKDVLKRGSLGVGRTIFLVEQIASALDAAHAHSLVHRDVKPGNILLEESTDHAYLTDFGVAKQTTARGLTSTGHFLGTVEYAAPEQIEGGPVDARTDVYALGCVLYECLTSSPPFAHGTEHAVLHAHLVDPPPSVTRLRPELPHAFDGVIATALAKDPAERYSSCGDLVHAARNAASGTARRAEPARTPARTIPSVVSSAPAAPVTEANFGSGNGSDVAAATQEPDVVEKPMHVSWLTPAKLLLLMLGLVVVASAASGAAVYFLTGNDQAATAPPAPTAKGPVIHPLSALTPAPVWDSCKVVSPRPGAVASAVCPQPKDATSFTPDRLELSTFASGAAVQRAYNAERRKHRVGRNFGRCNGVSWGGEGTWLHNASAPGAPAKPGGSRFCYFAGNNVVIVWTHRKFGQSSHTDLLGIAVEGGSDHPGLYGWWRFWHHRIGKVLA